MITVVPGKKMRQQINLIIRFIQMLLQALGKASPPCNIVGISAQCASYFIAISLSYSLIFSCGSQGALVFSD
jgi:3-oxoacyl-[acyl-carrier-protein] synthase III